MSKEQILNYIDVYDATPADDRKNKIHAIADELGVPPWEVAETLKAAGCSVNLQWFGQQKRKAMERAESGERRAEIEAPKSEPAPDVGYLKQIIERQDKMLRDQAGFDKERNDRLRFLEDRAKDLAGQLHEKDGEIAALEAQLRQKEQELEALAGQLEEAGADDDHEKAYRRLFQNHEAAKKINAGLRKELEVCRDELQQARDELAEQDARIRKYAVDAWEQDCRIEKLKKELEQINAVAAIEPTQHFFRDRGRRGKGGEHLRSPLSELRSRYVRRDQRFLRAADRRGSVPMRQDHRGALLLALQQNRRSAAGAGRPRVGTDRDAAGRTGGGQ